MIKGRAPATRSPEPRGWAHQSPDHGGTVADELMEKRKGRRDAQTDRPRKKSRTDHENTKKDSVSARVQSSEFVWKRLSSLIAIAFPKRSSMNTSLATPRGPALRPNPAPCSSLVEPPLFQSLIGSGRGRHVS